MKIIKKINCFLLIMSFLFVFSDRVSAKGTSATCYYDIDKHCAVQVKVSLSMESPQVTPVDKTSSHCHLYEDSKGKVDIVDFQDTTKNVWKCPSTLYYEENEAIKNFWGLFGTRYEIKNLRRDATASITKKATLNSNKSKQGSKYINSNSNGDDVYYCQYKGNFILEVNGTKKTVGTKNTAGGCGIDFSYEKMMKTAQMTRNLCPGELYRCWKKSGNSKYGTESYRDCKYYTQKQTGISWECESALLSSNNVTDANGTDVNEDHNNSRNNKYLAEEGGCGFIGPRTLKIIKWAIRLIRIGIPILIIILGITDFVGALFSGEDKTFKEALSKFSKRLLAGIILMFIPYILMFMVKVVGLDKDTDITVDDMFCAVLDD